MMFASAYRAGDELGAGDTEPLPLRLPVMNPQVH